MGGTNSERRWPALKEAEVAKEGSCIVISDNHFSLTILLRLQQHTQVHPFPAHTTFLINFIAAQHVPLTAGRFQKNEAKMGSWILELYKV